MRVEALVFVRLLDPSGHIVADLGGAHGAAVQNQRRKVAFVGELLQDPIAYEKTSVDGACGEAQRLQNQTSQGRHSELCDVRVVEKVMAKPRDLAHLQGLQATVEDGEEAVQREVGRLGEVDVVEVQLQRRTTGRQLCPQPLHDVVCEGPRG